MDANRALVAFVKLAAVSETRSQRPARDKFLALAAIAAQRAGLTAVAAKCRNLVLRHNPQHLIGKQPDMAAALADPEFQAFAAALERFCSFERAELHLSGLDIAPGLPGAGNIPPGEYALLLLNRFETEQQPQNPP